MITVEHPCPQEHPYRLGEAPQGVLSAWAQDVRFARLGDRLALTDFKSLVDALNEKYEAYWDIPPGPRFSDG